MGAVVIQDHVDVHIVGHRGIDMSQKTDELGTSVTALELADNLAGSQVQCTAHQAIPFNDCTTASLKTNA